MTTATLPDQIAETARLIDTLNRAAARSLNAEDHDSYKSAADTLLGKLRSLVSQLGGEGYPRRIVATRREMCQSRPAACYTYSDGRFHLPCPAPEYLTKGPTS